MDKFTEMGKEAGMEEVVPKPMYIRTLRDLLAKYRPEEQKEQLMDK